MAESWDVYDENRNKTGALHRRGDPFGPGERHLGVEIWTLDGQGRVLLTRRDLRKRFGGLWECPGGSALAGEDSRTAVRRELREETGLDLGDAEPELLGTTVYEEEFVDTYAVRAAAVRARRRAPPREGGAKAPLKAERFVPEGPNKPAGTPGRACGTGRSETIDARLAPFDEVERAILEGAPWLAGPVRERTLPLLSKLRTFRTQAKK